MIYHNLPQLSLIAGLDILLGTTLIAGSGADKKAKPNIMIIIADDCTYRDLPLYGGQNLKTPNIDRLASQGLTFNNAFVSMSMSVPCRASLYTGLYPVTHGVCWNHVPAKTGTKNTTHRQYAYFMHNNNPEGPPYPIRSVSDGMYHYIRNLRPENLYIEKHLMARMTPNEYWLSWIFESPNDERTYNLVMRYMKRPAEELYRIDTDPEEMNNLIGNQDLSGVKKRLSDELDRWMREQGDPGAEIDTKEVWTNATKGDHFGKIAY